MKTAVCSQNDCGYKNESATALCARKDCPLADDAEGVHAEVHANAPLSLETGKPSENSGREAGTQVHDETHSLAGHGESAADQEVRLGSHIDDPVTPAHYQGDYVMRVIEDFQLDFLKGTIVKYLLRAGGKPGDSELQDLRKAQWYLARKITHLAQES